MDNKITTFFPLSLAFISFICMAIFIVFFTNPNVIDPDHNLGISQFLQFINIDILNYYLDFNNTVIFFQLLQLLSVLLFIFLLYISKLITKKVLLIYLLTPLGAYLAVKTKMEFLVVILSLVRTDLPIKKNIIFILFLIIMFFLLKENNFIILIFFRLYLLMCKKINSKILFFYIVLLAVIIDISFVILASEFPLFSRFYWTRDIVNPEYSVIETIGVFISSFHLSFNPVQDWKIHMLFSLPLFAYLSLKFFLNYKKQNMEIFYGVVGTIYFFTSLTHAFQNARYYFFYIHILADLISSKREVFIYWIYGWLHVFILVLLKGN